MLFCFALEQEAAPFRKAAAGRAGASVLITGIGRQNAGRAVRDFLQRRAAQPVFTCGFAGGLDPGLRPGEVVFLTAEPGLDQVLRQAGAKPARFVCATRIATTAAEKADLRRQSGADAVEMESEAIHAVCRERGIPCATVRVISDAAAEDLPLDFNQLSRPDLSLDYGKLAWAIARSPGRIRPLLNLQRQCRAAAENLARMLIQVLPAEGVAHPAWSG
jgi:adenosylhomocysteine nucleosidase